MTKWVFGGTTVKTHRARGEDIQEETEHLELCGTSFDPKKSEDYIEKKNYRDP